MKTNGLCKCVLVLAFVLLGIAWVDAAPGDGISLGGVVLKPYGEVKSVYDSNVQYRPDDESDDNSIIGSAGMMFMNQADAIKIEGDLWGLIERYSDLSDEDHEDFGETISLLVNEEGPLGFSLYERYGNIEELDYGTGTIEERNEFEAAAVIMKDLTDKMDVDIKYEYKSIKYASSRLFDWDQHKATVEVGHALTKKTSAMLVVDGATQTSDGNEEDGELIAARAGIRTRQTDKLELRSGVGWIEHEADEEISTLSFEFSADWQATDKILVNSYAENDVEPAPQDENNFKIVTMAGAGVVWNMRDTVALSVSGRFIRNDFDRPVAVDGAMAKKKSDTVTGTVGITYTSPSEALEVFLEGQYEDKNATLSANEYDQTMVTVGMKLTY